MRMLRRIDSDHHHGHVHLRQHMGGEDGQIYLERSRLLLSHIPPGQRPAACHPVEEPHDSVGKRLESDAAARLTHSLAGL